MSADLQPLRQSGDMTRYGIDTAWLWEVISVWRAIQAAQSPPLATMSIHPTASDTNAIRALADDIKDDQISPSDWEQPIFASAMRTSLFSALTDLASLKVSFGTVPDDVDVGDTVEIAHVSDMFAWMQNVVCVHFAQSYTPAISSWTTDEDTEGDTSGFTPFSPAAGTLWLWQWYYADWTGTGLDWLTGGGYRRQIASDFTIAATLENAKAYWFKSAKIFLEVGASGQVAKVYVPLGTPTITQSGANVQISATCSAATVAPVAMSALSVSEVPYKSGVSGGGTAGSDSMEITAGTRVVCFLELADDYRYPVAPSP